MATENIETIAPQICRIEQQIREAIRQRNEPAFAHAVFAYDLALTSLRNAFSRTAPRSHPYETRGRQSAMISLLEAWKEGQKLEGPVADIWRDPEKLLALQASVRHALIAAYNMLPWESGVAASVA